MNRRAVGCATLGAAAFLLVGLLGIWRASAPAECPDALPYEPSAYRPVGSAAPEPRLDEPGVRLAHAGSASFGLARWDVYVEPGRVPAASGEPLPHRIVLDCRDGTFQAYQRGE